MEIEIRGSDLKGILQSLVRMWWRLARGNAAGLMSSLPAKQFGPVRTEHRAGVWNWMDHGLQTGRCHSLCSSSDVVF